MKKTFSLLLMTLLLLSALILSLNLLRAHQVQAAQAAATILEAVPASAAAETTLWTEPPMTIATEPEPTEAPWFLPVPQNIPGSETCPAVAYQIVHETVYAARILYVRSGPGSDQAVIGILSQGQAVPRGAIGNNGWSQILYNGQEAYASTMHLSVTPVSLISEDAGSGVSYRDHDDFVRAIGTNKLRTGPGFEYPVIGHLVKGSGAHRIAIGDNGWSRILFHDTEAFACSAYLASETVMTPSYRETGDTVYAADFINVRSGPGTQYETLAQVDRGLPMERLAVGDDGWSLCLLDGKQCYVCSAFLSREPIFLENTVVTSEPELPTPNSPFIFQYNAPEEVLPHALFTPAHGDTEKPLPLIISLHGALEIGESPDTLKANFLTKEFRNWEYTGLEGFDAYICCPQLTGYGFAETWSCPESADKLFAMIDYLKQNYNIDDIKISIEGHSLGGQGALYMAADPRADFSAVILVSAYDPGVPYDHITSAMRGYTGSPYLPAPREDWTSYDFMAELFNETFGPEKWLVKNCSHYDIPMVALHEDLNADGKSDLIEWILEQ